MGPRAGWGNLEMGVAKWANNPWEGVRIRLAGQADFEIISTVPAAGRSRLKL